MDEAYVLARQGLLDALEALGAHRDAIVLVGAQAVYLRVGEADLAVAAFTTDGDLMVDASSLSEVPPLERALMAAGFLLKPDAVGTWVTGKQTAEGITMSIGVDLLVPAAISPGTGRRAARLRGHHPRAARIVDGLDGALVDADFMPLSALDSADGRSFTVRVAGPAALLLAKVHKIKDRQGTDRLNDKDALDVLRLLRGTSLADFGGRYKKLLTDQRCAEVAAAGRALLKAQFASRTGIGVQMAIRSAGPLAEPDFIAAQCEALTTDLLRAIGS